MNKPRSIDEWKQIIMTARLSGMSDKAWCIENDINIHTFYYNVKRLRDRAVVIPRASGSAKDLPQKVVPIEIIDDSEDAAYECEPEHLKENAVGSIAPTDMNSTVQQLQVQDKSPVTIIDISYNGMHIEIKENAPAGIVKAVIESAGGSVC